jgi:hypothetical protein
MHVSLLTVYQFSTLTVYTQEILVSSVGEKGLSQTVLSKTKRLHKHGENH